MGASHPPQVTILNGSDIRSLYNFSGEQVRTPPHHPAGLRPAHGPSPASGLPPLSLLIPSIEPLVLTQCCPSVYPHPPQMASYFGYAVAATDTNGDG